MGRLKWLVGLCVVSVAGVLLIKPLLRPVSYTLTFASDSHTAQQLEQVQRVVASVLSRYQLDDGKSAGSKYIARLDNCAGRGRCTIYIDRADYVSTSESAYILSAYSHNRGGDALDEFINSVEMHLQPVLAPSSYSKQSRSRLGRWFSFVRSEF